MTDIQIAQAAKKENIVEIAKKLGLTEDDIEQYGKYKAKVNLDVLQKTNRPNGKLILALYFPYCSISSSVNPIFLAISTMFSFFAACAI